MRGNKLQEKPRERVSASSQARTPYTRYYQREPQAPAEPPKNESAVGLFSKLMNGLIVAILLFSAAYSLIDRNVSVSQLTPGSLHTKTEYNQALSSAAGNPIYRFKPLFNTGQVTEEMRQRYPEITDINYDIPWLGSRIFAQIETSRPVLKLTSQKTNLVIDEQGRAVTNASDVNNATIDSLPTVEDQTGYQFSLGQQALTKSQVLFIETICNQLKAKDLTTNAIILPPKAQELDVRLVGQAYYVKFFMGGDPLVQSGTFLATRQKLSKDGPMPAEYIDVRIEDRVYVK